MVLGFSEVSRVSQDFARVFRLLRTLQEYPSIPLSPEGLFRGRQARLDVSATLMPSLKATTSILETYLFRVSGTFIIFGI